MTTDAQAQAIAEGWDIAVPPDVIHFEVPGRALSKGVKGTKGQVNITEHEAKIAEACRRVLERHLGWRTTGHFRVTIEFDARADVDNAAKSILDGLKGVAFDDDRFVWELIVRRVVMDEPTTRVWVQRL
jgi:hypothetical protein